MLPAVAVDPVAPAIGQAWFNTTTQVAKVNTSLGVVAFGGAFSDHPSIATPTAPAASTIRLYSFIDSEGQIALYTIDPAGNVSRIPIQQTWPGQGTLPMGITILYNDTIFQSYIISQDGDGNLAALQLASSVTQFYAAGVLAFQVSNLGIALPTAGTGITFPDSSVQTVAAPKMKVGTVSLAIQAYPTVTQVVVVTGLTSVLEVLTSASQSGLLGTFCPVLGTIRNSPVAGSITIQGRNAAPLDSTTSNIQVDWVAFGT